jgi:cytidine deaminase
MEGNILNLTQEEIVGLLSDDQRMVELANVHRRSLSCSPTQSDFRVLAFLVVEKLDKTLMMIRGSNSEQGYIGGAICAERAALCSLRFLDSPVLRQVVVVTDSPHPTSPGVLCREYLMSTGNEETVVLMGNEDDSKICRCLLPQLYPFPYAYRYTRRDTLMGFAADYSASVEKIDSIDKESNMYTVLSAALRCNKNDTFDKVHPLRFSAAVLFEDGFIEQAWMLKGLEYGCTLDPVSQLVHMMERRNSSNICSPCFSVIKAEPAARPVMIAMVDQFGVAHAPFAQARCLLTEHDYNYVKVVVHETGGKLVVIDAQKLVSQPPGESALLSHDDLIATHRKR